MRRVNIEVSEETYKNFPSIIGTGSQARILGLVVDDFIAWGKYEPEAVLRYIAREIKIKNAEHITISLETAKVLLEYITDSAHIDIRNEKAELKREVDKLDRSK